MMYWEIWEYVVKWPKTLSKIRWTVPEILLELVHLNIKVSDVSNWAPGPRYITDFTLDTWRTEVCVKTVIWLF